MFQNILLIIQILITLGAFGLTYYLYNRAKNDDVENRAKMIYFQIKDIEENINYIKSNCCGSNIVWAFKLYESRPIYNQNLWDENKIYFAKKISMDSYTHIENFFKIATILLDEQKELKKAYLNLLNTKQRIYYERQINLNIDITLESKNKILKSNYDELTVEDVNKISKEAFKEINITKEIMQSAIDLEVKDFTPNISNSIIIENLNKYKALTDGIAYKEIKNLATIK